MKKYLVVSNSDMINRYGFMFSPAALMSALMQSWRDGVPSLISHDVGRLVGWAYGLSLYFEPGLTRFISICMIPESDSEMKPLEQQLDSYISFWTEKRVSTGLAELRKKLESILNGHEKGGSVNCAALAGNGLARRFAPEVFSDCDKHGLISLTDLEMLSPGVFLYNGFLLFAHPYFRRSLLRLNSPPAGLFTMLEVLSHDISLDVRIALDEDLIGLLSTYKIPVELEYIRGPLYSDDLSTIPSGVTVIKGNRDESYYRGINRTEFYWHNLGGARTLECEELRDMHTGDSDEEYGCRYVHSHLENCEEVPVHLDGAIRLYDTESMINRLDTDLMHSGRDTEYKKLWRIDGKMSISQWKSLISAYFWGSSAFPEYFSGEKQTPYQKVVEPPAEKAVEGLEDYLPPDMLPSQGVRISLTLTDKDSLKAEMDIESKSASFISLFGSKGYLEHDFIDIIKLARRRGMIISVPERIPRVAFEDFITNFPVIAHTGKSAHTDASCTFESYVQLLEAWIKNSQDRLVAMNIAIEYDEVFLIISLAGHISAVYKVISNQIEIPSDVSSIQEWCDELRDITLASGEQSLDSPSLLQMMNPSGLLSFKRVFLPDNSAEPFYDEKTHTVCMEFDSDYLNEHPVLLEALREGDVTVAPAVVVTESICTSCGRDYSRCDCCKHTDIDVVEKIVHLAETWYYWTTKNAFHPAIPPSS